MISSGRKKEEHAEKRSDENQSPKDNPSRKHNAFSIIKHKPVGNGKDYVELLPRAVL